MRLPYTTNPPALTTPSDTKFFRSLLASRPKGLSPLDTTLLHSPPLARGFMQFFTAIRTKTLLPADVLELAMCRVGALNGAAFEWMHHMPLLAKAGVSKEGIETVRTAPAGAPGTGNSGGLNKKLWATLHFVDAMTKDVKVPDSVFDSIRPYFSERQIVELVLTTAGYNAVSRFLLALDVAEMKDVKVGDAKL